MLTVPNKCFFMIASGKLGSCLVSRLPVKTSTDDPIDPSEPPATITQDKFAEIKKSMSLKASQSISKGLKSSQSVSSSFKEPQKV